MSPVKTTEPIKMPFGLRTQVGPRHHTLDGVQIPMKSGNSDRGEAVAHCKVQGHSAVSCANAAEPMKMLFGSRNWVDPRKMAELIEMAFGLHIQVGPRKHILGGMHTGDT